MAKGTLQERVLEAMNAAGLNQSELAEKAGVRQPSVANWIGGRTKGLKADVAIRAAKALGVNVEWLSHGTGPMFPHETEFVIRSVPTFSFNELSIENIESQNLIITNGTIDALASPAIAVEVTDLSFNPRIQLGESAIVDLTLDVSPGDDALIITNQDQSYIQKFLYERDSVLYFSAVGDNQKDIAIQADEVYLIKPVTAIVNHHFLNKLITTKGKIALYL